MADMVASVPLLQKRTFSKDGTIAVWEMNEGKKVKDWAAHGGGVYLWKSRAEAEAVYTPQWQAYIAERYGAALPADLPDDGVEVLIDGRVRHPRRHLPARTGPSPRSR
jgi:hypothetical protein